MHVFQKTIPKIEQCDVLVVGGGMAGGSAAMAAARSGAKTMLIEQYSVLGGAATVQGVGSFCGETKGQGIIFDQIIERLDKLDAIAPYKPYEEREARQFDCEILKYVLQEMVLEHKIELLLHTRMVAVETADSSIQGIVIHNPSGLQYVEAKAYIDATGDGFLVHEGGFECRKGRDGDGKTLPMSLMFFMRKADDNYISKLPPGLTEYNPENVPMVSIWPEPHGKAAIKLKVTGYDVTDGSSLTKAELYARREMLAIAHYLQRYPHRTGLSPEKVFLENYKFDYASMQIGVREGWRIVGEYTLTADDLRAGRKFDDGVALGRFYLDASSPDSQKREYMVSQEDMHVPPYHVPFRSLVPKHSKNLLVAGRCLSADQLALSSARVMTTCSMMGQAAGRAAAMMADEDKQPMEIDIAKLRRILIDNGAVL